MKILFVPLELLRWQQARSQAYTAQLAMEEGFRHHGFEVTTLPAWGDVPSSSSASWLSRAQDLLAGRRFDLIWVTLVHSPYDPGFLSWLATLAPVRIGWILESLNYTPEECALHPPLKNRQAYVERQLAGFTHVLTIDEWDAEQINERQLAKAAWWPSPVPARVVAAHAREPKSSAAEFYGTLYGLRTPWGERQDLRGILVRPPPPEDAAGLPRRFDALQAETLEVLQSGKALSCEVLENYLASWRRLRVQIFDCWMAALGQGSAQVNLPSLVKAYAGRVVESMAAGCPVISWEIPNRPRNRSIFKDGEEILLFQGDQPAQLAGLIRRVQREPEWACDIAERALRKVAAFHTVEQRITQVLDWVATGAQPNYGESATGHSSEAGKANDGFYIDLFINSPKWASPTPNADELARWTRIEALVRDIASQHNDAHQTPLRILDVGCGRGWLTRLLSDFGQAEGVEPVATVVEHARRLFPQLTFTAGDADTLLRRPDFAPYDLVVSSEVIEHVPEPQKACFVARLASLLKPGGHLILTTPRGEVLRQWTQLIGDPSQPVEDWMTEARLSALFVEQGFRVVGRQNVWFDILNRAFTDATPNESDSNFLAIYQVWAFQAQETGDQGAPAVLQAETRSSSCAFNPSQPDYTNTPASARRPAFDYQPAGPAASPVVAIVTPFYNAGRVFEETARSVFRQSLQQWEWLIINDGSTEPDSLRLLEEISQRDRRIRVLNHPRNKGLSAARNTGFKHARAPFVFQLDADDLIEPTALEKMAWHLATHPEFGFTTGFTVGFGSKQYLWRNGFHCGKGFLEENLVTATCLVRKSVHQAIGGYEEANRAGLEDWEFWLKAAANGYWGSTIPEFYDWYRRREAGREHWDNVVVKDKTAQFLGRLRQRYPALWEHGFPEPQVARSQLSSSLSDPLPFANTLTKERPRLLFIVPHFELGGADKFNLDLIRQLQREQGYQVTVVATRRSPNPWQHEFESLTPDVFVLNNFLLVRDFALFLRYLITSRRPDVVCLSNSLLGYQLLPCLRAHFPHLPFVDYLHMEEEGWMEGGYPRYSIHHRQQLARTAVSSHHLKTWMVERGAAANSIDVCPTNIDAQRWRRDRFDSATVARKWKADPTRPVILYAGRICDQKQPRVFAEVIRQAARTYPKFTALVAGDGPELPWLKEFAGREDLRQMRFLGSVNNEQMAELLAITDVFFLPSRWEGISLALYEAMAMGAVPLAAAVGGQAELVSPDCGVLIRPGDNEIAQYTAALLKLLRSPDERARMAQAARERIVQRFPISELGRRITATFAAARATASTPGHDHVLPLDLAALHAAEIVEQTRATDFADLANRERENLVPFVRDTLAWKSCYCAGQALLQARQPASALEMYETGLRSAAASHLPEVRLTGQLEIAKALIPLDRAKAEKALRDASKLAISAGDQAAGRKIKEALDGLKAQGTMPAIPSGHTSAQPPLVSVIIPCYRQAQYLGEAVESVLAQTFTDWEIIIVNDGSPDSTTEVARGLIARNPTKRISLVEQPNRGLPAARNAGVRAARGRYLLPFDADDRILPQLLERLVPILDAQPQVGFAYTHIQHFGALNTEFPLPDFDRATLIAKDNIACVCALFRKVAWEQAGGYNESMREGYEDWDFWVGCVEHGWDGHCLHEPLFLYRKHEQSMLANANQKRERLIARIILNHTPLYDEKSRTWARELLGGVAAGILPAVEPGILPGGVASPVAGARMPPSTGTAANKPLRITYLISSIQGVTGGNQTLLRQAEYLLRRGHDVTIVTYTPKPDWFRSPIRVIQAPAGQPLAGSVPPSDIVLATYFTNAHELPAVSAPAKIYYAQGDQFVFGDPTIASTPQNQQLRELSRASYLLPGIRFVPNSHNLANAVEKLCGRKADAILPVCTDQTIFRPLQRSLPGSRLRVLIVGPDSRGTEAEPLLFKGIHDAHEALQMLAKRYPHFTAVRMSSTPPDIFAKFPCEFYIAPDDATKTALFGMAHILIYASHYDSCPRPPQEAMAAGCAVVCTASQGALEYCRDGENSLLVPIQSPAAIADAVERLIHDTALREKLVQGGLATAREFPREREWNEWEAMLYRFAESERGHACPPAPASRSRGQECPRSGAKIVLPPCALVGHLGPARSLMGQKQLRAAWQSILSAIKARPFHPEAYLLLAQIAHTAGDASSARRCANYAHQLAPEWKPIKRFLQSNLRGNTKPEWLELPDTLTSQPQAGRALPSTASQVAAGILPAVEGGILPPGTAREAIPPGRMPGSTAGKMPAATGVAPGSAPPSAGAPRLSVCLIVKNEEKFLGQCLASVRDVANQIVVVDTGSTDRTIVIAREHGAEVHEFAWCDDFSAARNVALEHATGAWVLMLDADEELPPESHNALRRLLSEPAVMAWRLPIIDVGREDEGCSYVPRLFRNAPALFYVGRVHEQVFTSIEVRRQEWGLDNRLGNAPLRHHGYRPEIIKDRNKIQRNLRLLEQAIVELPDEPNLLMNYGLELTRAGQPEAGIEHYRRAFDIMSALPASQVVPETRAMLLAQLSTQLSALRRFDDLARVLTSPLAQKGGLTASLHFALGLAHIELKQPREAAEQMRQCVAKRDQTSLAPINPEIRKAGPHHCLASCLEQLGQTEAAGEEFQRAIQDDPQSRPARLGYARFLAAHAKPIEALTALFELANQKPDDAATWQLGGQIALSQPDFLEVALDWTAEAQRHIPKDAPILRQRAEALILGSQCAEALPILRQLDPDSDPALAAMLVLGETVVGDQQHTPPGHLEARVSREFLTWYQRLIKFNARPTVEAINAKIDCLESRLPSATRMLRAALTQAQAPAVA